MTALIALLAICSYTTPQSVVRPGAMDTESYFPVIKGKRIGLVSNQTSMIGKNHLVDSLLNAGFSVSKIFCPEHGFRGMQEAGEKVNSYKDKKTGITVVSLYGKNKKPAAADLWIIDIMIFDIQDVGTRFYTYLSTLHYVMESCAENSIPLIVLDRPNPNGFYIDGPILEPKYRSFVGLHPVPVVYGMTIGEYATMINGEKWLNNQVRCSLTVIRCSNYTHDSLYVLPVKPSPNLPNMRAVYLYPSLALFEGTVINLGRKTDFPFQVFGHPGMEPTGFSYTLNSKKTDRYNGVDLRRIPLDTIINQGFRLSYVIYAYNHTPQKEGFFNTFFYNLSGSGILQKQIRDMVPEQEIRKSWQPALDEFKKTRAKYLLYPDFRQKS